MFLVKMCFEELLARGAPAVYDYLRCLVDCEQNSTRIVGDTEIQRSHPYVGLTHSYQRLHISTIISTHFLEMPSILSIVANPNKAKETLW